jgi:DNA-binding transcriptional regulator YiaG
MPNIGTLLKVEISRLCRREVRKEVASVKKVSVSYRHDIAALKRQIVALERKSAALTKQTPPAVGNVSQASPDRPIRFVAKGLRSLRTRLGLSAAKMALLLGVSEQSVYNWETKKATPRKELLTAIIGMRNIGRREAQARLDAAKAPRRAKRGRAAK